MKANWSNVTGEEFDWNENGRHIGAWEQQHAGGIWHCENCGYDREDDTIQCPRCGMVLKWKVLDNGKRAEEDT